MRFHNGVCKKQLVPPWLSRELDSSFRLGQPQPDERPLQGNNHESLKYMLEHKDIYVSTTKLVQMHISKNLHSKCVHIFQYCMVNYQRILRRAYKKEDLTY